MAYAQRYKDKMDRLMRMDPGLDRRFPLRMHLPNFEPEELAKICKVVARRSLGRELEAGLEDKIAAYIRDFRTRDIPKYNASLAINMANAAHDAQITRLMKEYQPTPSPMAASSSLLLSDVAPLMTRVTTVDLQEKSKVLTAADFGISDAPRLGDENLKAEVLREVNQLIGMDPARALFKQIKQMATYVETGGSSAILRTSLNMIITVINSRTASD
jgi:hypothetical protein